MHVSSHFSLCSLSHSIAVSDKGWTDQEIGIDWLRTFNECTGEKAAGHHHLLVVDGHNSHYSLDFISYAREHKIVVLCYPAHTTHVLQGLDVVIFALLKRSFTNHCDKYNQKNTPRKLNKTSFLSVFGLAWLDSVTKAHIITSFHVTGVYPPDSTVIHP
jgi:hypothetical protein